MDGTGIIYAMQDNSKRCAYHEDFGHAIENCIVLRKDISYLVSIGYFKEILGIRNVRSREKRERPCKEPGKARILSTGCQGNQCYFWWM